jgi:germination protein M
MIFQRAAFIAGLTAAGALVSWLLFVGLPGWYGNRPQSTAPTVSGSPTVEGRKIKARLFYVAESGVKLTSVERDVPYGEGTLDQAKAIINAQLGPTAPPAQSAVPAGTSLRALFVTPKGEMFVDLSREIMTAHPGGSLNELLTVYTIVNVLTTNLPIVTAVQVLVEGKEVDTLAGHVDLRGPLLKNLAWVE